MILNAAKSPPSISPRGAWYLGLGVGICAGRREQSCLPDSIVSDAVGVLAGLSVLRQRTVDDLLVVRSERFLAHAEPVRDPGLNRASLRSWLAYGPGNGPLKSNTITPPRFMHGVGQCHSVTYPHL